MRVPGSIWEQKSTLFLNSPRMHKAYTKFYFAAISRNLRERQRQLYAILMQFY